MGVFDPINVTLIDTNVEFERQSFVSNWLSQHDIFEKPDDALFAWKESTTE